MDSTEGIYTLEELLKACKHGKHFNFVYFCQYKVEDIHLNPVTEGCFSLFFPCPFKDEEGHEFSDCIQYMMSQKAILFNDRDSLRKIMSTKDPRQNKINGHKVKNFDDDIWNQHSANIIYQCNFYKFSQNQKLHDYIISFPPNTIFVEANPDNSIYGIHLDSSDPKSKDPFKWEGKNILGFQITKVRDTFLQLAKSGQITLNLKTHEEVEDDDDVDENDQSVHPSNQLCSTEGIYSLEKLRLACSKGGHFNYVYFYGHNSRDISLNPVKASCFDQYFPSPFYDKNGRKYSDCIQFMMSQKAVLFNDKDSLTKIMDSRNPYDIKVLGRKVKNFDLDAWNLHSADIVFQGNFYKFSQNQKLHEFILSFPPNTIFAEADPNNEIYGIHLESSDPKSKDPFKWEGENLLGFQITKVRDTFLKSTKNGQFVTYAYDDEIKDFNQANNNICCSLDFLSSSVLSVNLKSFQNLTHLRISKCHELKTVSISHLPNLRIVDLLDNRKLQSVEFKKCPNLITLDVGFCSSLRSLKGAQTLKYLSAPFCKSLSSLDLSPEIVFFDATLIPSVDPSFIIENCHDLECFVYSGNKSLKLSEVTSNKSLKILHLYTSKVVCDKLSKKSNLKIIIFEGVDDFKQCIEGDLSLLNNIYVTGEYVTNQDLNNFTRFDDFCPEYQKYQRLLYGPWGIPNVDLIPPEIVIKPIISPPKQINHAKAIDSILGSLFASAVLDMVGVGVEFISNGIAKALLPGKMNISWTHPRCNRHNERFVRGTPTDDTSQTILIMRSIVDLNLPQNKNKSTPSTKTVNGVRIDPLDFGLKLIDWIKHGHKEHKHPGGLGVGATTLKVVQNPLFKTDPIRASYEAWEKGGKKAAPNGSVMRIASSGCFAFWDEKIVVQIADCYCKVTHSDPRCVYSSIAAALLIARYIQWNSGLLAKEPNIDQALDDAMELVPGIENYIKDVLFYTRAKSVDDLLLSEPNKIGYCLKAFGSAIWALRYCNSIDEALTKVLREGGDSDTNGAVVGALLGAKYGFNSIPHEMIEYMFVWHWIFREIVPYMKLMGFDVPPSPYLK